MILTSTKLIVATGCLPAIADKWIDALNKAMPRFEINTPARIAAFLAQIGVESAYLSRTVENLNYNSAGLLSNFNRHFTEADALSYQHQPERIANRAYASRFGNGDEASGDGWKFRGRGPIQITFHDNYLMCGTGIGLDLITNPDLLLDIDNGAASAAWYWKSRGCNELADLGLMRNITKEINGGYNGFDRRLALWGAAKKVIF